MENNITRRKSGILSGIVGIVCNLILAIIKLIVGLITSSISVMADAVNNLSDAVSNVITIIGSYLSGKPVDKEHPFGHGRIEYVSALIISIMILVMGVELCKSSVERLIVPKSVVFDISVIIILCLSILVKLFMSVFNNRLYKKTNNLNLKAVKTDSLSDCVATMATLLAFIVSTKTSLLFFDGVMGILVAVFICTSGIGILKDITGSILGKAPSKELVDNIEKIIMESPSVLGIHDLIIHDYGADKIIASVHVEMPSDMTVNSLHEIIDGIEKEISSKLNVLICIHLDPIDTNNSSAKRYKDLTEMLLITLNPKYTFHDFSISLNDKKPRIKFELVIPFDEKKTSEEIISNVNYLFEKSNENVELDITVEHSFN